MATNAGITDTMIDEAVVRANGGESCTSIAAGLGITPSALSYHFRKRGLSFALKRTMVGGLCHGCGQTFEYYANSIRDGKRRMYCSVECKTEQYRGVIHGNHIGDTVTTTANGYRMAQVPQGHVSRLTTRRNRNDRAPEHVIVAEEMIGRPLKKGEVVHHINGLKQDNRRCNLLVCTRSYHQQLHAQMSYLYQREHYGDL